MVTVLLHLETVILNLLVKVPPLVRRPPLNPPDREESLTPTLCTWVRLVLLRVILPTMNEPRTPPRITPRLRPRLSVLTPSQRVLISVKKLGPTKTPLSRMETSGSVRLITPRTDLAVLDLVIPKSMRRIWLRIDFEVLHVLMIPLNAGLVLPVATVLTLVRRRCTFLLTVGTQRPLLTPAKLGTLQGALYLARNGPAPP